MQAPAGHSLSKATKAPPLLSACTQDGEEQNYLPNFSISLWMVTALAQLLWPPSLACFRHSRPTMSACIQANTIHTATIVVALIILVSLTGAGF